MEEKKKYKKKNEFKINVFFNEKGEALEKVVERAFGNYCLKTVKKLEILPYHDMGKYKWENLGCKYELEGVRLATQQDVARAKDILGSIGDSP